eukprot:406100_1
MYEARVHPVIYRCCQQLNGCQYSQPFEKKNVSVGEIQMLQQSLPFNSCVAYAEQAMVVYWKFSCNAAGDIVTVQVYDTDSTCNEMNVNDTLTVTSSEMIFECDVSGKGILEVDGRIWPLNKCVAVGFKGHNKYKVLYGIVLCNVDGDIVTLQSYGTDSTCNETNGNPDDIATFTSSNASFECNVVDYYAVFNLSSSICAKNRDPFTPLCARCKPGTYELFGTTSCGNCNKWINILWIIPILIA